MRCLSLSETQCASFTASRRSVWRWRANEFDQGLNHKRNWLRGAAIALRSRFKSDESIKLHCERLNGRHHEARGSTGRTQRLPEQNRRNKEAPDSFSSRAGGRTAG